MFLERCTRILICATTLVCLAASARGEEASGGWRALLTEKKEDKPFPSDKKDIAELEDKEWLTIHYTPFSGFRPTVGVVFSEDRKLTGQDISDSRVKDLYILFGSHNNRGENTGLDVENIVRQALSNTGRFNMVERTTALDDAMGEQDFGASGRVDKKTAPKVGNIKGARYIVKAAIVQYDPEKESKEIGAIGGGIGSGLLAVGSFNSKGKVAWVRLNVRIIDSETSEIVQDMTVDGTDDGKSKSLGIGAIIGGVFGGAVGGGLKSKSENKPELSLALQACANKIAYYASNKFKDIPWSGAVASVNGTKITINGGTNVGLKAGQVLTVSSKGAETRDPETNEVLGYETEELGSIEVVSVQPKMSSCRAEAGCKRVKIGDFVRMKLGND